MGPVGICGGRGRGGAAAILGAASAIGGSGDGWPISGVGCGAAIGSATKASSAGVPSGFSSLGGSCFHLWLHLAQRTVRPRSPRSAASSENLVVQDGQETITDSSA